MSGILDESVVFGDNVYSDSACTFCDGSNTDDCVKYLNQELSILGLGHVGSDPEGTTSVPSLLNVCHELLCLHQREVQMRTNSDDSYHRLQSDYRHMQLLNGRLTTDMDQTRHNYSVVKEKLEQSELKNKSLALKLKANKEEMKRLQSVMQSRDNLQKHVMKKREMECGKLKDRLNSLLSDKPCLPLIEMNKPAKKFDGKRGTWRTGSSSGAEEKWQRFVISTYEDQQHALILENRSMRDMLESMHQGLEEITGEGCGRKSSESDSDKENSSTDSLTQGHFQMPFELVKKDLDKKFEKTCKHLQNVITSRHRTSSYPSPPPYTPPHLFTPDKSEVCDMNLRLKLIKKLVKEQEDVITKKQQTLDRCELRPVQPNYIPRAPYVPNKDGLKLIHTTPIFSPTPKAMVTTPSTAELYRWMGFIDIPHDEDDDTAPDTQGHRDIPCTPVTSLRSRHSHSDEGVRCRPRTHQSRAAAGLSPPLCPATHNVRQSLCARMSSGEDD